MRITNTCFPENTGFCGEIDDFALFDVAICEIHFKPQLIMNAGFEVAYQRDRG